MTIDWTQTIISIVTGLLTIIPLTYKLIEYVLKANKEKNWGRMLELVMQYMQTAEEKFKTGAEKKEWVLAMVKASANTINYDIDLAAVGNMIDNLCNMTKVINPPVGNMDE